MKIFYNSVNGKIFYAVPDRDLFYFSHTTNIPLTELVLDELAPVNQPILQDLLNVIMKKDKKGLGKYYINSTSQLIERTGWVEFIPSPI